MAKIREIKGRIKAIGNIERITKTMQMIATARFQASLRAATESRAYTDKIGELVADLAASCASDDETTLAHPLLRAAGAGRRLLLVLTSNRGLCGGYNANILRTAGQYLREHAEAGVDVEVVGKKGTAYFRFTGTEVAAAHTEFSDPPSYEEVEQLAERYMKGFVGGIYAAVDVAYMTFQSVARQSPGVQPILPLADPLADSDASAPTAVVDYDYSPDPDELLNELLPVTVKTRVFQCFNEATVGEHIARMVAMKNATDSASKMGKELNRSFNRARQAAITTELSEIIGGAAALG
ncbi:MAG: ATP synthase F1 subunit gamma [Phycisphaeraceae bacterium]|nr:ATP synthase F1 subunit gamma [Phycisphaeraceae bacterium]